MNLIFSLVILSQVTLVSSDLEEIDRQIETLTREKQHHEATSLHYREQADRWQFYPGRLEDARNSFEREAEEEAKAQDLQRRIEELQKKREELLKNEKNL